MVYVLLVEAYSFISHMQIVLSGLRGANSDFALFQLIFTKRPVQA